MKKRALSMLLCFSMVFSMLVQFAPAVQAEATQTETNIETTQDSEVSDSTAQGTDAALSVAIDENGEEPSISAENKKPYLGLTAEEYLSGEKSEGTIYPTFSETAEVSPGEYFTPYKVKFANDTVTLFNNQLLIDGWTFKTADTDIVTVFGKNTVSENDVSVVVYLIDYSSYEGTNAEMAEAICPEDVGTKTFTYVVESDIEPYVEPTTPPSTGGEGESGGEGTEGDGNTDVTPDFVPPHLDSEQVNNIVSVEDVNLSGYFVVENVLINRLPMMASKDNEYIETAKLPDFVTVVSKVTEKNGNVWYYIENTQSWENTEHVKTWGYCYIPADSIVLVDADVTQAYESLMGTTTVDSYEELAEEIDITVLEKFTDKHNANLSQHYDNLVQAETRTYTATEVYYKGKRVPVSVTGIIPDGLTLSVVAVEDADILTGGFDVKTAEDIALALDIKLLNPDSTEWQPKKGRQITVEMGVTELGYQDGRIFQLEHKHGEDIFKFDIFIVMDGKITVKTSGFSVYVVSAANVTNGRTWRADDGGTIRLTVGEENDEYFYALPTNPGFNINVGTWQVVDTEGAIFWEVYSNENTPGNNGTTCPWIRIIPLKPTDGNAVTLTYTYANIREENGKGVIVNGRKDSETFTLIIDPPKATTQNGVKLYIKDTVNTTGKITATLVDGNGNEKINGLDGASITWERSDGMFIIPQAYSADNASIDICRDHAGLLQSRIDEIGTARPEPGTGRKTLDDVRVTYTATVELADGQELTADYTVYYQSEILNAGFEAPTADNNNYNFFPNGWEGLFWKTTAPGTEGAITRDVEYAKYSRNEDVTAANQYVSFFPHKPFEDTQLAELNAEAFGALYQDIITAPGENIEWDFRHARRDSADNGESLFVVMGPTEKAQEIVSQEQLEILLSGISADDRRNMANGTPKEITAADGTKYMVWYHYANQTNDEDDAWTEFSGSYIVPKGQYRTRLFFVSDPYPYNPYNGNGSPAGSRSQEYGNLIDAAQAGHYKTYLVEYYEESFDGTGAIQTEYKKSYTSGSQTVEYDEHGTALIYSTVPLINFLHLQNVENDYLSRILINGANYPYNIRYPGQPALFIESYDKTLKPTGTSPSGKNYADYDIVMRIYFRDTMIAGHKVIEFPTELTTVQKMDIINSLPDGYTAKVQITSDDPSDKCDATVNMNITMPDPAGQYTAFSPLGNDHKHDSNHYVTELSTTELPGLNLKTIKYTVTTFSFGQEIPAGVVEYDYVVGDSSGDNKSPAIRLYEDDERGLKIETAEVEIRNIYEEEEITITYKAIGKGKVAWKDDPTNFLDAPTEKVKYYSGDPKGAAITAGENATFMGWYKEDENGNLVKVKDRDGVVDAENSFEPNNHVIDTESITFYAVFETGSIVINRENAAPFQTFTYHIKGTGANPVEMYITIECDENGKGSAEILEVPQDNYTITEIADWSWRHKQTSTTINHPGSRAKVVDFTNDYSLYWLSGTSEIDSNVFGKAGNS